MGSDRRNDKRDEVHQTVPVFGVAATEGPLAETDGPSEESAVNRSPAPISSPMPASGTELPSVIEPGVVLLNKYRVLKEIGHGGMGSVWLVEHLDFGEKRALKVIHAIFAADAQVRARFKQEAKILAKLKHPNAVIVYDTGIAGKSPSSTWNTSRVRPCGNCSGPASRSRSHGSCGCSRRSARFSPGPTPWESCIAT